MSLVPAIWTLFSPYVAHSTCSHLLYTGFICLISRYSSRPSLAVDTALSWTLLDIITIPQTSLRMSLYSSQKERTEDGPRRLLRRDNRRKLG